ncbi:MAG: hypothetical protein A2X49_11100 [Lentisphaerae bacterium GWF2_52_8]|nr:MAG: hypothetical protein A2X49_11100 [Lentisphaerae bacterium GWF2_52_8]
MAKKQDSAFEKAAKLLSIRGHSCAELTRKLVQREYARSEIEGAVSDCIRLGYLNDDVFARSFAEEMRGRGWGPLRIKGALFRKGLPKSSIEAVMEAAESSDFGTLEEQAIEALRRRLPGLLREPDFRKRRQKACRFLLGRGFPSDTVFKVAGRLLQNDAD